MGYETVIGLEVHCQMKTRTKLFCGCRNVFGEPPNTQTCPVCTGMPGVLPVLNAAAFEMALKAAVALECGIAPLTKLDRKNYYYPDLPKNYQISQYDMPLSSGGHMDIDLDGRTRRIGITRVHLEEDAGKLLHAEDGSGSMVDLNRAGTPLIEIVSEPEIRSPREASVYLQTLRLMLVYLGVSDCNMQEGSLRCDANISMRPEGASKLGTKTEVKNMNSFKGVEAALAFEAGRQERLLASGGRVEQETRLWDQEKGETRSMRSKEFAHDYRYFPEPDLPPIAVDEEWIGRIKDSIGELPARRLARFQEEHALSRYDAEVIVTRGAAVADYFEEMVAGGVPAKAAANYLASHVFRTLNEKGVSIEDYRASVGPRRWAQVFDLQRSGKISSAQVAPLADALLRDPGASAEEAMRRENLEQVSDSGELLGVVEAVLAANPEAVADFRKGRKNAAQFLLGQAMKQTRGKANPQAARELLDKILSGG